MAHLGADVDALEQLSRLFDREAQNIQSALGKINGQVHQAWWQGRDGDQFRSEWDGNFKPGLQRLITALQDASRKVRNEATQQRNTSNS